MIDDSCKAVKEYSYPKEDAWLYANTVFRLICSLSSVSIGFLILLNPKLKRHPGGLIGYICVFIGGFLQLKGQLNFVCSIK